VRRNNKSDDAVLAGFHKMKSKSLSAKLENPHGNDAMIEEAHQPSSATVPSNGNVGWLRGREVWATVGMAAALVAVEIYASGKIGLLTLPPEQDGASYMSGAKYAYAATALSVSWQQASANLHLNWPLLHSPLWIILMALNFFLFGPGEWQSYVVRFWPVFLLLSLALWLVRRRCEPLTAWSAGLLTALLPVLSPSLNAALRGNAGYISHPYLVGSTAYLADLRPDLLFAILTIGSAALLIEHAEHLRPGILVASGTAAACAVLCKPTATPGLLLLWGFGFIYVFIVHRRSLKRTLRTSLWALPPFILLIVPYLWAGGYQHTLDYLKNSLGAQVSLWSIPHATIAGELRYYWTFLPLFLGTEGIVLLTLGFLCFVLNWRRCSEKGSSLAYLALAAAWYLMMSFTAAKNPFLGLPFYLVLWLFSLIAIAAALRRISHVSWAKWIPPTLAAIFAFWILSGAISFLLQPPSEAIVLARQNRAMIQQAAYDAAAFLGPEDCFATADFFGFTGSAFPYYLIGSDGAPLPVTWDPSASDNAIPTFLRERVNKCNVGFAYAEDSAELDKYWRIVRPPSFTYYRAQARFLRAPGNGYELFKSFPLSLGGHTALLQMYVRRRSPQTTTAKQ
jgi:hypothetical protein